MCNMSSIQYKLIEIDFDIWPLRTENSSYLFQYGSVLILSLNTASENRTLSSWVIFVHIGPSILICFVNFIFAFRLFLISYLCLPGCSYFPRGTPEGNMNCLLIPTILSPLVITIIIIIIIITRPSGIVGPWGQDTDQAGIFWGVLNHEKPTWNLEIL